MTGVSSGTGVAVLTIGDEILSGEVADSNFPQIARAATALGVPVTRHVSVGDDISEIALAVVELCKQAGAVIITGGLGPTSDDITTEAVAEATGRDMVFHRHIASQIEEFFNRLGRPMSEENLKQAYLPSGSTEIPAAGGTAPGFMLTHLGVLVAALPGVPREMEAMLESHVMPELARRFRAGTVSITRKIHAFGSGESDIAGMVADLIGAGPVRYGFLALGGPVMVKLTVSAPTVTEAARLLDEEEESVRRRLGLLVYGVDDETMEEVVGRMLASSGRTIAVAESCTGGLICSRLTNVPGSSAYFKGGLVTYAAEAKAGILDVPLDALALGAVSVEVAAAMASGVRALFAADIGVGVTGLAGPGTAGEGKPAGTLCLALSHEGGIDSHEVRLPGDRQMFRSIATMGALQAVRLHLSEHAGGIGWFKEQTR